MMWAFFRHVWVAGRLWLIGSEDLIFISFFFFLDYVVEPYHLLDLVIIWDRTDGTSIVINSFDLLFTCYTSSYFQFRASFFSINFDATFPMLYYLFSKKTVTYKSRAQCSRHSQALRFLHASLVDREDWYFTNELALLPLGWRKEQSTSTVFF